MTARSLTCTVVIAFQLLNTGAQVQDALPTRTAAQQMGPQASGLWTAPSPAPISDYETSYNVSLPPWETNFSSAEVAAQRRAGAQLLQDLSDAVTGIADTFTIGPGTYRISSPLEIGSTVNFTVLAAGVELIAEDQTPHVTLNNNTDFTLEGPLILDGDPFGFSQGTIIGSASQSYILVRQMDGYPAPTADSRLMFFNPEGIMQPLYQLVPDAVQSVQDQAGVFNVTLPGFFWSEYSAAHNNCISTGNLLLFALGGITGGINLGGNNGVRLANISVYSAALTFGLRELGHISIESLQGVRRPGTNRLSAGGWVAVTLHGGSLHMSDSELAYNLDDLTDVQSGLAYAFNQTSPTSLYVGCQQPLPVGSTLRFYNLATLAYDGAANISATQPVDNPEIVADFQNGLTDLNLLSQNIVPSLVTLDAPVTLSSPYDLVDHQQARASSIVFENSYFHDSLGSGINAKGAKAIVIRNNVVERAGYRGAAVGFDPYWQEGGIPANVLIEGNQIVQTPYNLGETGQAISSYVDTSAELLSQASFTPIHNFTVRNNVILNPPVAGIGLSFSANNVISGNMILRPVAAVADNGVDASEPFTEAAAIFLDTVAGTTDVVNNTISDPNPQVVPQLIRVSEVTNTTGVKLCNNAAPANGTSQQMLPDEFWTKVSSDSALISYPQASAAGIYRSLGSRFNNTPHFSKVTAQGVAAVFSFTGTRARWYTCLGRVYGMAGIAVDGGNVSTVDTSVVGLTGVVPDPNIGFCDQAVFDTGSLPLGDHVVEVMVTGQPGALSQKRAVAVAVVAFDYLPGVSQCDASVSLISAPLRAPGLDQEPLVSFASGRALP